MRKIPEYNVMFKPRTCVSPVKVELGCGRRKRWSDFIGIDKEYSPGVDIVWDMEKDNNSPCIPLVSSVVDEIYCSDFIEHIFDTIGIMKEIWRVLKDRGIVTIIVPSTDGRGAFQDPTHKSFWNENSFGYWVDKSIWADSYRGFCVFRYIREPVTVGISNGIPIVDSGNPVSHVHVTLAAIKDKEWLEEYDQRSSGNWYNDNLLEVV